MKMEEKFIKNSSTGKEFFKSIDKTWNLVQERNKFTVVAPSQGERVSKKEKKISMKLSKDVIMGYLYYSYTIIQY